MKKHTRREFLRDSGHLAVLLSVPSLALTEVGHAAGLANEAMEFIKEATHVVSTYGEHKGWYKGHPEAFKTGRGWWNWTCEHCGYRDNYFESCKCEQCGECWEVEGEGL